MNLNKGISTPIAILLIIAVSAAVGVLVWQFTKEVPEKIINPPERGEPGDYTTKPACEDVGYYWYDDACHETEQTETDNWKKSVEKVVKNYGEALETRKKEEVLPYTTGKLKEEYKKKPPVFGTSNPHPDGIEILSSEKVSGGKFKVQARSFEAYTGEGRIGYSDNTYIVEKVENEYLISEVESGEYITIDEKEETELSECEESDDGQNYYKKGTTHGTMCVQGAMTKDWEDGCAVDPNKPDTLVEYYCAEPHTVEGPTAGPCEANVKSTTYQCPNGCENGACLGSE